MPRSVAFKITSGDISSVSVVEEANQCFVCPHLRQAGGEKEKVKLSDPAIIVILG